jgi:hypothetical protein
MDVIATLCGFMMDLAVPLHLPLANVDRAAHS